MAFCTIHKNAIEQNYRQMSMLCKKNNAQLNVVSKFCLSNPLVISFLNGIKDCPCTVISDSNMENFARLEESLASRLTKCVIKTRLSDIKKIPSIKKSYRPDRLFVSDMAMLNAIAELPGDMRPEIVLIAETGDLKDGFLLNDIMLISEMLPILNIIGVSANFSCLSGILPDIDTVCKLYETAAFIQKKRSLEKPFLSVGGTVIHGLAGTGSLDGLVQEIRSGEGIFFGYDSSGGTDLAGFSKETISLDGEVLEVAEKDFAIREGHQSGFTATGNISDSNFEKGLRKRAVLDFGILAALQKDLIPADKGVVPVGQTFDFTVVDVTGSARTYAAGETVSFYTNYASASFAMMNRYIPCNLE
ncbi:MAG: hypothetical protein K6G00_08755 [Treponema sp.]|nr:hypothetical protein [Treponema sp.]